MTSGRDKVSEAELGDYLGQAGLRERLGGSAALLRAVVRGVLEGGAKSLTHSVAALERYAKPIKAAVEALEGEGEAVCIEGEKGAEGAEAGWGCQATPHGSMQATCSSSQRLRPFPVMQPPPISTSTTRSAS